MAETGILFPGQGSQEVGMGRRLAEAHPPAAGVFQEADRILGYALSTLCFEGPAETLTRTDQAQAAIFTTSVAAVTALETAGRCNRAAVTGAAGLSLGEYTALWFAGALEFEDGLRLVALRGAAMQAASEAAPSGMVSLLGADRETAQKICDEAAGGSVLVVANLNAPGQVVVSGDADACGRVPAAARRHGVRRAVPLKVAGAFHSPFMEPAREQLEEALERVHLRDPGLPVYSNVTAAPVRSADEARRLLVRQVVAPVLWEAAMRRMIEDGFKSFYEPAPGRVLTGLMRKIDPDVTVTPLDEEAPQE